MQLAHPNQDPDQEMSPSIYAGTVDSLFMNPAPMVFGAFNADYGLAMVRPEHQAFYRRVFLQETSCEPRLHPGLVKPVGLMAAHLPTVRERVLARYPFLRSSAFERRMLFERNGVRRPSSPDVMMSALERTSIVPQP